MGATSASKISWIAPVPPPVFTREQALGMDLEVRKIILKYVDLVQGRDRKMAPENK
jgi:hypothetical protein